MCGAAELLKILDLSEAEFEVVGSAAVCPSTARDLDILVRRHPGDVAVLSAVVRRVAVGDWRPKLARWLRGAVRSPITIATIHGPLDIWEADDEAP